MIRSVRELGIIRPKNDIRFVEDNGSRHSRRMGPRGGGVVKAWKSRVTIFQEVGSLVSNRWGEITSASSGSPCTFKAQPALRLVWVDG